jgi:hypothetical protein
MDGRRKSPQKSCVTEYVHVSEPELDMRRETRVESGALARLRAIVIRLVSGSRRMVSPMRSIGRELEESWPAQEH